MMFDNDVELSTRYDPGRNEMDTGTQLAPSPSRQRLAIVLVSLVTFGGGTCLGLFLHNNTATAKTSEQTQTSGSQENVVQPTNNSNFHANDGFDFDLHDPSAPWNIPAHSDSKFDPSIFKTNASDPDYFEFLPGDLDDTMIAEMELEYNLYLEQDAIMNEPLHKYDYLDRTNGISGDNNSSSYHRALQFAPMNEPLSCNDPVPVDCTSPLSGLPTTDGETLTIPCGQCVYFDYSNDELVEYKNGIVIEGKLYFPPEASATILTTHIIVLGFLEMEEPEDGNQVTVRLYGNEEIVHQRHSHQPNSNACNGGCSLGSKPIAVIGGQVDIKGYSDNCPAWEQLLDTASSTTIGGDDSAAENLIINPDASGPTAMRGYGNGGRIYCDPDEPDNCAHMAFRRNNWPRGLAQAIDPTRFDGTGTYEVSFRVKMILESALPEEEGIDCDPLYSGVWCPTVRIQTRKDGVWSWTNIHDTSMVWNKDGWSQFSHVFEIPPIWTDLEVFSVVFAGGPGGSALVIDDIYFGPYVPSSEIPGPVDQIIVSQEAAECWNRPGAEILITTSTRSSHGEAVMVIDSVDTESGTITFTEAFGDSIPSTLVSDPEHAAEVALLSRKIVFEAEKDEEFPSIGGHLVFHQTSGIKQHLQGVEIRNFGQQGNLGKYPVHFHICEDAAESTLEKIVVRQSNQRCFVIHGTQNVTLYDNVAYDAKGHCYILEEGSEHSNTFTHNLGAKIAKPTTLITTSGRSETDGNPSVFWITNANNNFKDNVAAGCEHSGFWFETHKSIHVQTIYQDPSLKPVYTSLGLFEGNTAHACDFNGFTTYPPGWQPELPAVIEGLRVYRCNRMAVFLHNTRNIQLKNAYIANNGYLGILILGGDDILIENTLLIGKDEGETPSLTCRNRFDHVGVTLHGVKENNSDRSGTIRGTTMRNVEFRHWSPIVSECGVASQPLSITPEQYWTPLWSSPHLLSGISIDEHDGPVLDACRVVDQWGMEDVSLEISNDWGIVGSGKSGFLVGEAMVALAGTTCVDIGGCLSFCEGACLRIVKFLVNGAAHGVKMVVSDGDIIETFESTQDGPSTFAISDAIFSVSLPKRPVTVHFVDADGETVWPSYATPVFEAPPLECSEYITEGDITIVEPECSGRVVKFGDFENNIHYWQQLSTGITWSPDGGVGNSPSLQTTQNTGGKVTQWLDVTCLEYAEEYDFSMSFRLVGDDGLNLPTCDNGACVQARILFFSVNEATKLDEYLPPAVWLNSNPYLYATGEDFSVIEQTFTMNRAPHGSADRAALEISFNTGKLILDDVAIDRRSEEDICGGNVLINSDFETGSTHPWNAWGTPKEVVCEGANCYMRVYDRANWVRGVYQHINTECMEPGDIWHASAMVRLVDSNGIGVDCIPPNGSRDCPLLRLNTVKNNIDRYDLYLDRDMTWNKDGWNYFEVEFALIEQNSGEGLTAFKPVFAGGHQGTILLLDDVQFYKVQI